MGMKQTIKLLGILILCFSVSACSKNDGIDQAKDNSTLGTKDTLTGVSKPMDEGNVERIITLKNGLKDETLKVSTQSDNNGLLELNVKEESNLVLLCRDSVNDINYYVNYGKDYFVYRMKDGITELVVKMPAKRLFFEKNKIYFMLESFDKYTFKDMKEGSIFCYDPRTGDISSIYAGSASTMSVYEDGIYYTTETTTEMALFCYSFADGKNRELEEDYLTTFKWKDYFIAHKVEDISKEDELYKKYGTDKKLSRAVALVLKELNQNEIMTLSDDPLIQNYAIAQDKFYYMPNARTFIIYDLITKEKKEYSLLIDCEGDFTVLNGELYIDSLLKLDLSTGEQSLMSSEKENEKIYELYTDGKILYGVSGQRGGIGYGTIQQIEINEQPEKAFKIEKENGTSLEMNRFQFRTIPMGKE